MNNLLESLDELNKILNYTRQLGNTFGLVKAVKDSEGVLLTYNYQMTDYCKREYNVDATPFYNFRYIAGTRKPVFIDNGTMMGIIRDVYSIVDSFNTKIDKLKNENRFLINDNSILQAQLHSYQMKLTEAEKKLKEEGIEI